MPAIHTSSLSRKSGLALGPLGVTAIFMLGFGFGHLHATLSGSSMELPEVLSTSLSLSAVVDRNGWKTMDVFVGNVDDHQKDRMPQRGPWFAQARQDEVVAALLHNKTKGYFVDLAANDAFSLSNTAALEFTYKWDGLCIEPNDAYWHNLTHMRRCRVIGAIVGGGPNQRSSKVKFRYDAGDHSGIAGEGFDNGAKFKRSSTTGFTVPLAEILSRSKAPSVIDYLSLDVEGAEQFILEPFPFDEYKFRVLTAERPKEPLRQLLESHGYVNKLRLTKWGETLYIHGDFAKEMDLDALDAFDRKKRKDEVQDTAAT